MAQEKDPMPTGDRPWSAYHKSRTLGISGFAGFIAGFGVGFLLTGLTTSAIPPALGGLAGGVALAVWTTRTVQKHEKLLTEAKAAATRQRWAEKEAKVQRQIAEMKEKEAEQ
ncbi:hypothetical protein ACUXV3_04590 [Roseobacteraceae bacterium NS-SX3]